jgi:hypothetical protein
MQASRIVKKGTRLKLELKLLLEINLFMGDPSSRMRLRAANAAKVGLSSGRLRANRLV